MLDDRMEPENLKDVAAGLMEQAPAPTGGGDVGTSHPDRPFARDLFGESNDLPQPTAQPAGGGLDLSPLQTLAEAGARGAAIREDLVQQAAQALVRDQNDAFLAITHRMTPDEIGVTLATARQWRRPDPTWQQAFRSAPETGFSFIDRESGKSKKPNKAEALAREIVEYMREHKLTEPDTPRVVRHFVKERGIPMGERQIVLFAARLARQV